MTLYNLTQQEANKLLNYCDNDLGKLALILWNKGKVKSIDSGIKRAKKIQKFAQLK